MNGRPVFFFPTHEKERNETKKSISQLKKKEENMQTQQQQQYAVVCIVLFIKHHEIPHTTYAYVLHTVFSKRVECDIFKS